MVSIPERIAMGKRFKELNKHFITLYPDFPIEIPDAELSSRSRGMLSHGGLLINWVILPWGQGECLEYYRFHRFGDEHVRIVPNGESEGLPTLDTGYFFDDSVPGDKLRAEKEHKKAYRRLYLELADKGLLDPVPTRTMMNTYLVLGESDTKP